MNETSTPAASPADPQANATDLLVARLAAHGNDPLFALPTADILHTVLERLEQLAWMIDAENRIANRSIPRPIHE